MALPQHTHPVVPSPPPCVPPPRLACQPQSGRIPTVSVKFQAFKKRTNWDTWSLSCFAFPVPRLPRVCCPTTPTLWSTSAPRVCPPPPPALHARHRPGVFQPRLSNFRRQRNGQIGLLGPSLASPSPPPPPFGVLPTHEVPPPLPRRTRRRLSQPPAPPALPPTSPISTVATRHLPQPNPSCRLLRPATARPLLPPPTTSRHHLPPPAPTSRRPPPPATTLLPLPPPAPGRPHMRLPSSACRRLPPAASTCRPHRPPLSSPCRQMPPAAPT